MPFDIAAILALPPDEARALLKGATARELFPEARAPEAALAGLYLHCGCWNEAHEVAQDIPTAEGSYWHAIVHRQEPDDSNAAYWFRQVGRHAIFPELAKAAAEIGIDTGKSWDPFVFIELCAKARACPGSALDRQVAEVQRAEWQLLFDYCAVK